MEDDPSPVNAADSPLSAHSPLRPADPPRHAVGTPEPTSTRLVVIVLAFAAVAVALIAARAWALSSDASGSWQQALRQQVKSGAAVVEEARFVYADEARGAFRIAQARVREDEYRKAAAAQTGPVRDALLFEADVQAQISAAMVSSSELAHNERYARPDGGYDVILRLADQRALDPALMALDPDATEALGDRAARKAVAMMATTLPVGFTFVFGALAQPVMRLRRYLLVAAIGSLISGVILAVVVEVAL